MSDAPPPSSWPPPSAPPPSEPTEAVPAAQPPPTAPPAPTGSIPPVPTPGPAVVAERPKNGMIVAVLVLGVSSLVAAISFVLFPLGLIAGIVGVVLGIIALTRSKSRTANKNPAIAGLICSAIAVIIAVNFTVQVGSWVARNTSVFTRFDTCIAKAHGRADVAQCIAKFANEVRP